MEREKWFLQDTYQYPSVGSIGQGVAYITRLDSTYFLVPRIVDNWTTLIVGLFRRTGKTIEFLDEVVLGPPPAGHTIWIGSGGTYPNPIRLSQGSGTDAAVVWASRSSSGQLYRNVSSVRRTEETIVVLDQAIPASIKSLVIEEHPQACLLEDGLIGVITPKYDGGYVIDGFVADVDAGGAITVGSETRLGSIPDPFGYWITRHQDGEFIFSLLSVVGGTTYNYTLYFGTFSGLSLSLTGDTSIAATGAQPSFKNTEIYTSIAQDGVVVVGYALRRADDTRDHYIRLLNSDKTMTPAHYLGHVAAVTEFHMGNPSSPFSNIHYFYAKGAARHSGTPIVISSEGVLEVDYVSLNNFRPDFADMLDNAWLISSRFVNNSHMIFLFGPAITPPLRIFQRDDTMDYGRTIETPERIRADSEPTTAQHSIRIWNAPGTYW